MSRAVCKMICYLATLLVIGDLQAQDLHKVIRQAQQKVVKIYGAGGLRQMESYQSGIIVSPEGHVLTTLSYVLDTDDLAVVLDDGRKFLPERVGTDPLRELALLKLPLEEGETVPYFDLKQKPEVTIGERVMALSNLYGIAAGDEPVSVLQGMITAIAPLDARRGSFATTYRENVYITDAYANNPGATGGALVNWQGELLGLLGKELKSRVTGTWLNYALPVTSFAESVDNMIAGRANNVEPPSQLPEESLSPELLGIRLIPDVLRLTPPYIDAVRQGSSAEQAGLRPDDLIVFAAGKQIASCRALIEELSYHDQREEIDLVVLRDGAIVETSLQLAEEPVATSEDSPAEETSTDEPTAEDSEEAAP